MRCVMCCSTVAAEENKRSYVQDDDCSSIARFDTPAKFKD